MIFIFLSFFSLFACLPIGSNCTLTKLCFSTLFLCFVDKGPLFELHRPVKFFLLWLVIAALGSYGSQWPLVSMHGFHLRYEGFLTYLVLSVLAWLYWSKVEGMAPLVFMLICVCIAQIVLRGTIGHDLYQSAVLTPVAQGSLFCMIGAILYARNRLLVLFALPGLLVSGCRSGVVGLLVAIGVHEALKCPIKRTWKPLLGVLIGFCLVIAFSPLGSKLAHTKVNFKGARSQWIVQSYRLMRYSPLFGYGLDTGSFLLVPASGPSGEKDVISDRSHNIFMDYMLFTGVFGVAALVACLGFSLGMAHGNPTPVNLQCSSGLIALVVWGLMNPLGIPAISLALICLFGIRAKI